MSTSNYFINQYFQDYDRTNPATQQTALNQWMNKMEVMFNRERQNSERDYFNTSLFKTQSIMKTVPRKVLPQTEQFPFFQYRHINPHINEPVMFQFLDPSQSKNAIHHDYQINPNNNIVNSFVNLQNMLNHKIEDSIQKHHNEQNAHSEIKKHTENSPSSFKQPINKLQKQNSHKDVQSYERKPQRFLTVESPPNYSNSSGSNKFSINLFQVQNQSINQSENDSQKNDPTNRPYINLKQSHPSIKNLNTENIKDPLEPLKTDQLLLELEQKQSD